MKLKKIEFARQTNFILALLLIHFVFFGYLSNLYMKRIGEGVLYLHQVLFRIRPLNVFALWSIIIAASIICIVVFVIVSKTDKKFLSIILASISFILIIPVVLVMFKRPEVLGTVIQVPTADWAVLILAGIVFFMVFRERFFEYGIRNSIWLVPFIMIQSWIWYWFIIERFDITIIGAYFLNINSYITILTLLGINLTAAILGAIAREKYTIFISRTKKIEV